MKTISFLLLLALSWVVVLGDHNYAGCKAVRAYLADEKQVAEVQTWELDVWSRESTLAVGWNDMVVNEKQEEELTKLSIAYETLIDSIEDHLEESQRDLDESRSSAAMAEDFFVAYHTYAEYVAYWKSLSTNHSKIATYIQAVANTIDGRDIPGIVVTGTSGSNKKKIFISGGQHAREWVSPATVTYIITQLVTKYGSDSTITNLLNSAVIHFVPMVNPDGYTYTWQSSSNRLWRKNRRLNTGGSYGVDLNRNWDDHWGGEGSSPTPTSDTYRGTAAFSEPESRGVAHYVNTHGPFNGAIDYHSYSQLILRPYGWTNKPAPNEALAKSVGDTMRARILAVHNVAYTSQASWQLYYTTGSAQDWYYTQAKIPLSYTIELRDTGTYGFQLPASQIKPCGAENLAGFLYFVQAVLSNTQ